jgi:hypothetical protein
VEKINIEEKIKQIEVISFRPEDRIIVKVPNNTPLKELDQIIEITSKWANISRDRIVTITDGFEIKVLREKKEGLSKE